MASLLERLYTVQGGGIYLDGTNILEFERAEWVAALTAVSQEPVLFSGAGFGEGVGAGWYVGWGSNVAICIFSAQGGRQGGACAGQDSSGPPDQHLAHPPFSPLISTTSFLNCNDVQSFLASPPAVPGTIGDNIAYGKSGRCSQEDIERAARAANAHGFISELPDGYDTLVGERGSLLSGEWAPSRVGGVGWNGVAGEARPGMLEA